eukprot:jgi/Hompol1/1181/HPOL_004937-RA
MPGSSNWLGSRSNLDLTRDEPQNSPASATFGSPGRPHNASTSQRRIFVNTPVDARLLDEKSGRPLLMYKANKIRTSKYTMVTFLPKNIFEQFRGIANFYFLSLVILQTFAEFKEVDVTVTAAPIIIIVCATAIKDGIEDLKRHESDAGVNKSLTYTLGEWQNPNYPQSQTTTAVEHVQRWLKSVQRTISGSIRMAFRAVMGLHRSFGNSQNGLNETASQPGPNYPTKIYAQDYLGEDFMGASVESISIIFLFITLCIIVVGCASGQLVRQLNGTFEHNILKLDASTAGSQFGLNMLTYVILFNNLIPLSLIVTMEFVRYSLGALINTDLDMYYEVTDTPATARTSSLVEELGQIDYIFSDKTGTLTRNIMEFRMASIAGIAYAESVPDDKRLRTDEHGNTVGYYDFKALMDHRDKHENSAMIREFLTLLAVCHTVIPEADEHTPGKIAYQASSPDEAALVSGAASLGYLFHTRRPKSVTIAAIGQNIDYEILNVNEFDSTRKRMSLIVRDSFGNYKLYIKGADTVIYERLAPGDKFGDATSAHLEEYANEGLRTLCLAYRDISEAEYLEWSKIYTAASTTINNRTEALQRAAELIETNLTLLGATAIEDKLQEGVPDTIHTLMEAGIKIWVLTGDRQETAINIGYSCKLITPEMNMLVCDEPNAQQTKAWLEQKLKMVKSTMGDNVPRLTKISGFQKFWKRGLAIGRFDKDLRYDLEPLALVINGSTLNYALAEDMRYIFLELAMMCKAVICCRVSPLQKALVVKLVRFGVTESVTLAIGDGANDVSMIQAAHVGVGISGMEGLQAARAADFAIGQFRFLRKLLLVHGSWAYSRISKVITYSFYKNITLYMIQLWYATTNGFSGQTLFETWAAVSTYNVVWTLVPPIAIGVFDQFVSARVLDRYPQMYQLGQRCTFYSNRVFFSWFFNSFLHSALIFVAWVFINGESNTLNDGRVVDNWAFGSMVYITNLLTVLSKACLVAHHWVNF